MAIRKGDKVQVMVPNNERFGSRDILAINHEVFRVSKVRHANNGNYYELEGAESKFGIPYSFAEDWLIQVGDFYE